MFRYKKKIITNLFLFKLVNANGEEFYVIKDNDIIVTLQNIFIIAEFCFGKSPIINVKIILNY